MGPFSILSNQGRLLAALMMEPSAEVHHLALRTGGSVRATKQLLRDLDDAGFITSTDGATPSGFVVTPDMVTVVQGVVFEVDDIRNIANNGVHGLLAVLRAYAAREMSALANLRQVPPDAPPLTLND